MSRSQIKRQYGQYSKIRVNEKAPLRNTILNFVGNRFITDDEMQSQLTKMSEEIGKEFDQRTWFKNNKRYFESFENRGQLVWTLSKYGKRVFEFINKPKQNIIMENKSIGLFKSSFLNESRINEAFATLEMGDTLEKILADYTEGGEDEGVDIKVMTKCFNNIAKLLKGNLKTISSTMEEGDYEFSQALNQGLKKRVDAGDTNIERTGETSINSPFDSSNSVVYVTAYLIKDANVTCACWNYGDDFATFDHVAYPKNDGKKLLAWVNKNMTEDDMDF